MALQQVLESKYGIVFDEAYYRIRNFTTVRAPNGDVSVTIGLEVWINKAARDNLDEPIDYVVYDVQGTAQQAEAGTLSQLYQMVKAVYMPEAIDILETV